MADTPIHVAAIMDGNGRWARRRGLPRTEGHRRGADAARRVIRAAPDLGIGQLTLFAFSCDNWKRPRREVAALMELLKVTLNRESRRSRDRGVRLSFVGRRDRLDPALREVMARAEERTREGDRLDLRIALDYSARHAIAAAARRAAAAGAVTLEGIESRLAGERGSVDLLIRTGGERRLSDFLLWECAYAELWFTDTMWPDFGARELARAVASYRQRDRRFGALPGTPRATDVTTAVRRPATPLPSLS